MFPNAQIHTLLHIPNATSPIIDGMKIHTSPLQWIPKIGRHYRHWLPLMPLAARSWNVGDVDLVISLSHCVAKSVRCPAGIPHVCYCFTPMRYAWQTREKYLDRWRQRPILRSSIKFMLDRLRDWDRSTAARVDHFVGISRTVCRRIEECYGRTSTLIPPPVETSYYTPADIQRNGAYLCVSALVPYKRIDHAVIACSKLNRPLVVIGKGPERSRLEALAGPTVEFLGYQPDDVIRDQMRRCRALLFPGEEDFGIVPIEALACSAPVIALGRGGAAETLDERVGAVYDDESPAALAAAIERWEAQGRPSDPAEARRRALLFEAPLYRQRLTELLVGVMAGRTTHEPGVPRPHGRSSAAKRARAQSPRGETV